MTAGAGRRSTRSRSRSTDRRRDRSRSRERRHDRSRDRRRSPERSQRDERARESRPERRDRSRSRSRSPRRDERRAGESYRGRSGSPHGRREGGGYRSERARAEEWAPQDSSREQEQQAMPAPARRGPGPCFKCGEEGHMARECPNAPAGGSSHGPCYKCGEAGHIARDCPNPEAAGAGPGSRRRRQDDGDEGGNMAWGKPGEQEEEAPPDKEVEPEFGLSGALAAETNRVNGVVLLHQEPPEARKPTARWRLYVFKNGQPFGDPLHIHRMSSYLFGRERRVADVPTDHPSCSKQHAVLQFRCGAAVGQRTLSRNATTAVLLLTNGGHQRNLPALPLCRLTEKEGADGMMHGSVRPYLMDLGSTNGTFLNGERLEPERYYELLEKDLVRFGNSTREYVLLKEK